jgi:pimeloyl-ACP methyl ester carboxylesterase
VRATKNKSLLQISKESIEDFLDPYDRMQGNKHMGSIGYTWESVFEAKPDYLPWDEVPSWYIVLEEDKFLPMQWQINTINLYKRMGWSILKNAGHGPFYSHREELLNHFGAESGPVKSIRKYHEDLIFRRSLVPIDAQVYYRRIVG